MREYFTVDNTEGFTHDQLCLLNEALDILRTDIDGAEDYSIHDAIAKAWAQQESAVELAASASRFLKN